MIYRRATAEDVEGIAALHADSWRRHYRGAYSDAFLDSDVFADRLAVWTERLSSPAPVDDACTIVADNGDIVGLAHTFFDEDPEFGALLDNLHVRHDVQRKGIGAALMAETASAVIAQRPGSGLYLFVLEPNTRAQAFYQALGGEYAGREESEPPGGGTVVGLRYVWRDPGVLLESTRP
jgi:ribosomal protein S18 acetylase RimI-like enzyme